MSLSTQVTTYGWTTLHFRVEYADGSVDYIFAGGTVWGTFNPSYTTPADKTPVALYIWAAASWAFPPIQVDIGQVSVTPVSAGQVVVSPAYGFTGEWWETDLNLLHLRARWLMPETGTFLSRDPVESEPPYQYVRGNPVNRIDPSGNVFVTFDDGPVDNDARILNILRGHNARATFFFHGDQIDLRNPLDVEVVWRVAAEGSRLGNHSYYHPDEGFKNLCMKEQADSLNSTEGLIRAALLQIKTFQPARYYSLPNTERDYIDNVIEYGTGLFRPPGGSLTSAQQFQFECWEVIYAPGGSYPVPGRCKEGVPGPYNVSWWTVDPWDWAINAEVESSTLSLSEGADIIYNRIIRGRYGSLNIMGLDVPIGNITSMVGSSRFGSHGVQSNRDNILLHSTSGPTVEALDRLLQWLKGQGYTFDLVEPSWSTRN